MTVARSRPVAIAILVLSGTVAGADAQIAGLRTEKLAEGVYAVLRTTRPADASDANTLVIVNQRDVIVVDANITPRSSELVIAEIRKLTRNPVRYVITTHYHSDHFYGNQAYRLAWPGVEFVAHSTTWTDIVTEDEPAFRKNISTEYPAEMARLRGMLSSGKNSKGEPLTEAQRRSVTANLATYESFIRETRGLQLIPPTLTFDDSLVFRRGARTIVARHLGRGNTRGDVVVYLPKEGVVATGDLVVSPMPFAFGSFLSDWVGSLGALRSLPVSVVLPGHGEPMRDWGHVVKLSGLLCATLERVRQAMAADTAAGQVRKAMSLTDWAARFGATDAATRAGFDYLFTDPAVERAIVEQRDAGPAWRQPAGCAT